LVGLRRGGQSTIGQALAAARRLLVELDAMVEKDAGLPLAAILPTPRRGVLPQARARGADAVLAETDAASSAAPHQRVLQPAGRTMPRVDDGGVSLGGETASAPRARACGSTPLRELEDGASGRPASFRPSRSSSTKETPSRLASACPMVLLPAPRRPTNATTRRSVRSCWAARAARLREEPRAGHVLQPRHGDVSLPSLEIGPGSAPRLRLLRQLAGGLNSFSSRRRRTAAPTEDSKDLVFPSHEAAV